MVLGHVPPNRASSIRRRLPAPYLWSLTPRDVNSIDAGTPGLLMKPAHGAEVEIEMAHVLYLLEVAAASHP
jgi:hypothetical protein